MTNNDPFLIHKDGRFLVGFRAIKHGVDIAWTKSKDEAYPFSKIDFAYSVVSMLSISCQILRFSKIQGNR